MKFLLMSLDNLLLRDKNCVALNGEEEPVVGVDIEFIKPENSDIVINNNQQRESLSELAQIIVEDIRWLNN